MNFVSCGMDDSQHRILSAVVGAAALEGGSGLCSANGY